MLEHFIYANYAAIVIVLFMLVFLQTNVNFEKRVTNLFKGALLLVAVLIIADSVESWTAGMEYPTRLRIWMSAIGYTARPICIMCVLEIVIRDRMLRRILLLVPAIINAIISFSALFTDIAYYYTADNEFVRGPLGWSPYIVSSLYLIMLIVVSAMYFREKNYAEGMIVLAIVVAAVVAVLLERELEVEGIINVTIALSLTFYYLYFHTQTFKRDYLTHALNRRSLYMDAERNREHITAVISIDLNDLKMLNDTMGHHAGDEALCTLTRCVEKHLLRDCLLYRTGGDEFTVLCMKKTRQQLETMVQKIREEVAATKYSCAIGLAMRDGRNDFDSVCAEADKAMYRNKQQIKSAR